MLRITSTSALRVPRQGKSSLKVRGSVGTVPVRETLTEGGAMGDGPGGSVSLVQMAMLYSTWWGQDASAVVVVLLLIGKLFVLFI